MLDQASKFLELFKTFLECGLSKLAKRELVCIITNIFKHGVEMVLAVRYVRDAPALNEKEYQT